MADITVGGKGFEGVIATFNTSCVTSIKITPTVDWVDFTIETNTVNARVEAYTGDNPRQQSFTLSFTALTENNDGSESETACTKNFSIEQLSKNFHPEEGGETPPTPPTPTNCKCLVDNCADNDDLHIMTVSSEAGETCDSAHAPDPTKYDLQEIAYTTNIEDENSWVVSSTGWLTATIEHTKDCNVGDCNEGNVGAKYVRTENDTGNDRYARVKWGWQSGVEIPECQGMKMCEYSYTYIKQLGGETPPSEPCEVELTVNGLEGTDKATIHWEYGNQEQFGNGTTSHTYSSGGKHTASVSAPGYTTDYAYFDCENGTTALTATIQKSAGGCSCDDFVLNEDERIQTISSSEQTMTVGYTLPDGCNLTIHHYPEWVSDYVIDSTHKKISITASRMESGTIRYGVVDFYVDGTYCSDQYKAIAIEQKKEFIPESWIINLRIANTASDYACIDSVEIFIDGFSTSLQTDLGECVNAGGEENLGTVTLPNSASAPEGSTITRIEAVVSDGTGTPGVIKTLTTNNSTLTNGGNYKFTYNG